MKLRLILAAAALALAPGIAAAQCNWSASQSASQCGAGQVWDGDSQTCVTPPSS